MTEQVSSQLPIHEFRDGPYYRKVAQLVINFVMVLTLYGHFFYNGGNSSKLPKGAFESLTTIRAENLNDRKD